MVAKKRPSSSGRELTRFSNLWSNYELKPWNSLMGIDFWVMTFPFVHYYISDSLIVGLKKEAKMRMIFR